LAGRRPNQAASYPSKWDCRRLHGAGRGCHGKVSPLPTSILNKFGYGVEFDSNARYETLAIDFEAIADHLHALHEAAKLNGIGISGVIFEKAYIPRLYTTARGAFVRESIPFMQGEPWIRHDEHYHVDFAVRCQPLPG